MKSNENDREEKVITPLMDILGGAKRQKVFMNGMAILAILLIFYVLVQMFALFFVETGALLNRGTFVISILTNLSVCIYLLISYRIVQKQFEDFSNQQKIYKYMIVTTTILFLATLLQIHLVGSQNSLHLLLIVAVLLVVSWFFHWREVILFFVFGNLGLAALVTLEVKKILSYAPLFKQNAEMAELFLDWRIILGQAVNYFLVLIASMVLVWKLRCVLEKSDKALHCEIDERKYSEHEKEKLIEKLQESLSQVKTLRGLLPICMHCKNVRDDKGYWRQLESYLKEYSPEVEFTHGLCPKCAKELYPEEMNDEE